MTLTYAGAFLATQLEMELEAAGFVKSPTSGARIYGVNANGTHVDVIGMDDLTQTEIDGIATVIAAHDYLAGVKALRVSSFKLETRSFIVGLFPIETQSSLNNLKTNALHYGMTNRAAYIAQLEAWIGELLTYHYGIEDEINAATTVDACMAVTYNYDSFAATTPNVGIRGAYAIAD